MKRHVEALVRDALSDVIAEGTLRTAAVPEFRIDAPRHPAFGDLACDVALVLGRQLGESPHAIGATIVHRLRDPQGWLADVGVGGPGFVNFRFAPPFWHTLLREAVAAGAAHGRRDAAAGRRVRVELAGAGADAIIDARATVVADAVGRLLADDGAVVERAGRVPALAAGCDDDEAPDQAFDQLVGVLSTSRDGALPWLRRVLASRGAGGATLRVLPVAPVRLTRDGEPVRGVPDLADLVGEIGSTALRFLLLLARAERVVDLDLELAKRHSTDNPLFVVQYAIVRLPAAGEGGAGRRTDLEDLSTEEVALLRPLVTWPDVVEAARRGLEPERVAGFTVELALAAHRWLNRLGRGGAASVDRGTRQALASCLRRLLSRALLLCTGPVPEGTR